MRHLFLFSVISIDDSNWFEIIGISQAKKDFRTRKGHQRAVRVYSIEHYGIYTRPLQKSSKACF